MHEALARIAEQIEGTRFPTARGANAYRPADVDAWCDAMADRLRSAGPVDREELSGHARDARFATMGFGRGYACADVDLFLDGVVAGIAEAVPPAAEAGAGVGSAAEPAAFAEPFPEAEPAASAELFADVDAAGPPVVDETPTSRVAAILDEAFPAPIGEDAYEVADIEAVVAEVRTALAGGGEEADRCAAALAALTAARPRQAAPGAGGWDRERVDAALIAVAEQLRSGAERAG